MSRFDHYVNPTLARRRFREKVLFALCWLGATLVIGFILLRVATQSGPIARYTFTGSPVADAVGMALVLGFVPAVVVVLAIRRVRGFAD